MHQFTSNEVCAITGVPYKSLQGWIGRGHYRPNAKQRGPGRSVSYGMADVLQAGFLFELSRLGIGPAFGAELWTCAVGPNSADSTFRLFVGLDDAGNAVWRLIRPTDADPTWGNAPAAVVMLDMAQLIARIGKRMREVVDARMAEVAA